MLPMLDGLALEQVQELTTHELRLLPEHKPPGMAGSILQNLGRRPTRITVHGVAVGAGARDFVDKLDAKFRAAKPVPFVGDIVADAKLDRVLIDDLQLQELAGKPARFAYVLVLREFIAPKVPATTAAIDGAIRADALALAAGLVPGLGAGAAFVSGLEPFVGTLSGLLARLQAFDKALSAP